MNPDKTKIILVGNSSFPNWNGENKAGENKNIPNVDQNIENLQKTFLNPIFFGIPDDQRHLITIKDETSQEILLRVKHETKSYAEKNQFERLIFYYAGHGIPGEDKKLFFAAKDTVRSDYEITSVDSDRLFSYLTGFGARELIVILDCCYAAQSKENMGDADSLIENALPKEKDPQEVPENGTYYLFASGKDNVAKFNPGKPDTPTYFTEALLNSIKLGTEPGIAFIQIGVLFKQLQKEILNLKAASQIEIPSPRPILVGDVSNYLFCKNIKFENQEDKDWADLVKDPSNKKIQGFEEKYPESRFDTQKDELTKRLSAGRDAVKKMTASNDINLAIEIKSTYKDIPMFRDAAIKFIRELRAKAIQDEDEIEKEALSYRKTIDSNADQKLKQASDNMQDTGSSAQTTTETNRNARTGENTKRSMPGLSL